MTPTKLLVGQIFVVFAIVIAGVWAATQWCAAQLSAPDSRLGKADEEPGADEDGGLQQQRHPSIEEKPRQVEPATQLELLDLERDDPDAAADKRVMDRVRATLVRGHAMNQSQSQDLLPGL